MSISILRQFHLIYYSVTQKQLLCSFLCLISLSFSNTVLADIPTQLIAYHCLNCHTQQFKKPGSQESQSAQDLYQTLLAFKYDKRPVTIMDRISKGFTDQELKSVAQYITNLK